MGEHIPMVDQERVLRILIGLTRRSDNGPPAFGNLRRELVREGMPDPEALVNGLQPEWVHDDGPLTPSRPVRITFDALDAIEPGAVERVLFIGAVRRCYEAYIRHEPASPAIYESVTVSERELLPPELDPGAVAMLRGLLEVEVICRPVAPADSTDRVLEVSERISELGDVADPAAYRRRRFRVR